MFREQELYGLNPNMVVMGKTTFDLPLRWEKQAAREVKKKLVFTCSWSDFFIEEADAVRGKAWEIMRSTPHLIYQVLTKRPERIVQCLPGDWGRGYSNVWLGVSVEDQKIADERIPELLCIPARVHFVSCEPLLEAVKLDLSGSNYGRDFADWSESLDWVIVGGESGEEARKMDMAWAYQIIKDCRDADIPVFVKQLGSIWAQRHGQSGRGADITQWPGTMRVRQMVSY
jgi:protein gp37